MLIETGYGLSSCKKSTGDGGNGPSYLDSIIDSVCCDLDATQSASYGGSGQTWANLIASPADGAAQTDYDFWLGADGTASADDPTFNGTAGDAGAYWSFDGGDFFRKKTGITSLLNNLHKTTGGSKATIIMAVKTPSSLVNSGFLGSAGFSGTSGIGVQRSTGSNYLRIFQFDGIGQSTVNATQTIPTNTDALIAIGLDIQNDVIKTAINATSFNSEAFTANAATDDATYNFHIAAFNNGGFPIQSGYKMYGFYIFNDVLTDAELAVVVAYLEARHGRDYTP